MDLIEVYRLGLTRIAQPLKVSSNAEDAMSHSCNRHTPGLAIGIK